MVSVARIVVVFAIAALICTLPAKASANGLTVGTLVDSCSTKEAGVQFGYCLGFLVGVHETIIVMQKINGSHTFCMKVEARTTAQLLSAFTTYIDTSGTKPNESARMATALAYAVTWPCGE